MPAPVSTCVCVCTCTGSHVCSAGFQKVIMNVITPYVYDRCVEQLEASAFRNCTTRMAACIFAWHLRIFADFWDVLLLWGDVACACRWDPKSWCWHAWCRTSSPSSFCLSSCWQCASVRYLIWEFGWPTFHDLEVNSMTVAVLLFFYSDIFERSGPEVWNFSRFRNGPFYFWPVEYLKWSK